MRTPLAVVLSAALISALLTGTAAGDSVSAAHHDSLVRAPKLPVVLTKNPLYRAGPLPQRACPVPGVRKNDTKSYKKYLSAWFSCLDQSWRPRLKAARLPFVKPKIRFITDPQTEACGTDWQAVGLAQYCDRTIVIFLRDSLLKHPEDLLVLNVAAYEYGNHLQDLSGIGKAVDRLTSRSDSERESEYLRRYNLQAGCLASVFLGSVWNSLHRPKKDWRTFLDAMRTTGDDVRLTDERWHGKGRTVVYWLNRGFTKASPSACNTWAADETLVA